MARRSIYLYVGNVPNTAIVKGLTDSGDDVVATHTISDTLVALQQNDEPVLLVADVQAGAIALLSLLKEQRNGMPAAIMLFDREGDDIHTAIKALQLGVREYLLASDAEIHRELSARLMAERVNSAGKPGSAPRGESARAMPSPAYAPAAALEFRWDPTTHLIQVGQDYVRLSPIEGRIFDLLLTNRNRIVAMRDLIEYALMKPDVDEKEGAKLLRPHLVRLRGKLERQPDLAHRIVNMRGSGYMMI